MWQFVGLLGGLGGRFGAIMYKPLPPLEEFKKVFEYDPDTGDFIWLIGARKGKIAGSKNKDGIELWYKPLGRFKAHRVAWLYTTGEDPGEFQIDHKDRNPFNNEKENLRKATNLQNSRNTDRAHLNSSTGVKGIDERNGRFRARLRVNGVRITVGTFWSLEEAQERLEAARREYHGEFACDS